LPYLRADATGNSPSSPLVVLLHGARDRGRDPEKLLAHGLGRYVAHAAERPYHFLALQIPENAAWADWEDELLTLLDTVAAEPGVDSQRIVLAGFSAGSAAVWHFASRHPERFAALVVVAGQLPDSVEDRALAALARTPIWVFHGGRDERVPEAKIRDNIARIHALGLPVRFTFYPEADHFISDTAYNTPALQHWLATVPRRTSGTPRTSADDADPLFINRWSPRAFADEAIDDASLFRLLEAARWAPSAGNSQPWRFIHVRNGSPRWKEVTGLLSDNNRPWASKASALVLLLSRTTFIRPGTSEHSPAHKHSFDAGAAWAHVALQASLSGWHAHAITGYDTERARALFQVPEDYDLEILIALGRLGDGATLPPPLRERETPGPRRPLVELVAEDRFAFPHDAPDTVRAAVSQETGARTPA
jgi:predicted esterase/nitroreductase